MSVLLSVEESIDASYFTIQRTGGDTVTVTEGTVLHVYLDNVELDNSITFTASDDIDTGIIVNASEFSLTSFEDGIYSFIYNDTDDTTELGTATEGFAAVVAGQVMRNSLTYRVGLDYKTRYTLQEEIMLLNNLSFAATLGSVNDFNDNLQMLEDLL